MRATVSRKVHFNSAHRLHNSSWSDEKNIEIFGKCNNRYYHGHNYTLIIKVIGNIDPESGFVIDMKLLKHIITEHVINKFDHKNLNIEVEEFEQLNPTMENIAMIIWNILRKELNRNLDIIIKLHETENNCVEYPSVI